MKLNPDDYTILGIQPYNARFIREGDPLCFLGGDLGISHDIQICMFGSTTTRLGPKRSLLIIALSEVQMLMLEQGKPLIIDERTIEGCPYNFFILCGEPHSLQAKLPEYFSMEDRNIVSLRRTEKFVEKLVDDEKVTKMEDIGEMFQEGRMP